MKSRFSRRASARDHRTSSPALGSLVLAAGALLSPFTHQAEAATQTLNTSGNWDTTSAIWNAGSTWLNGNDASFGGTAAAIEIAGSVSVAGFNSANALVFNDASPGGSLTLVSAGGITPFITGSNNVTFNVGLAGTSGLTINKVGGAVTLNADNPLSGPLTVTAGTLVLGANGALNSISSLDIAATGSVTTGAINQIAQTTVTNAGTLTLGGNDTVAAFVNNGGTLNGSGILRASTYALNNGSTVNAQLGNGIITTNGAVGLNANTGTTGSLTVQSGTTTTAAAIGATVVNVSTGATLNTTAAGTLADTAAVTLTGTGTLGLGQSDSIGNLSGGGIVALGGNTLTLSDGGSATSSAAIGGTGGITLQSGTQTLSGTSTYTGATNVTGGSLVLAGSLASTSVNVSSGASISSNGAFANATNLSLGVTGTATFTGNETLANLTAGTGAINATGVDLTVTGTLDAAGNITVDDLAVANLNGTSNITSTGVVTASAGSFGGVIVSGSLVKTTAGTLTLTGPQTFIGGTTVNAGTLALAHGTNTLADAGALTVNAGATVSLGANTDTVSAFTSNGGALTGTGTLTAATYALNNGSTIGANLGAGALTANGTVALNGNTGTSSVSIQSGTTTLAGASSATTVGVANGATLATTGSGSLADTAAVTLTGTGALTLGQSDTVGNLSGVGFVNLGSHTLSLANGANATSAAVIGGTGGVTLQSGTQTLSGTNTFTGATNVTGGTLALTGSLAGNTVNVSSGAVLTSTGGLSDGTVLTLTGSAAATFTGAETLASLNGAGTLSATNLAVGSLNGTSTVTSSGTVTASSGSFGGVLATGSLVKDTGGTLTLSATQTYIGGTTVTGGTLALAHATNTLADAAALTVNPGATVNLGANTDTVSALTSTGGTLAGTGTLTAATYALNNASTVNANLGAGTLTANGTVAINGNTGTGSVAVQSGTTTLAGASSAATVNISSGATLATTASERLADTAAVTNAGTLSITGNETVGSLSNTGTIAGSGVLTTAAYNLSAGSNITGNLGAGVLNILGNTGISGTSAATTVAITGGTLTLTGNNLADTAAVTNSAGLALAGNDTVASLANSGAISGTGTLTAATYTLATGSNITGNLGTGIVNVTGAASLSGTSAAGIVNVANTANLTISGNNLADTAVLTNDGTLTVQGNDTVGAFVNNAGSIGGFGTLTAATYTLNNGTVLSANLGAGALTTNGTVTINGLSGAGTFTVASGTTTLTTTSAANTVNVTGGSLILTADAEINVATTVGISTGAALTTGGINQIGNATLTNAGTLTLGGNDTIAAYVANGGTLNGTGRTLTAATYALDAATVNAHLGNGALTANGTVAINGTVGTGSFTVQSGLTTLVGTAAADTVTISGGTLALASSNLLADTATLTNAGTLNLGANSETVSAFVSSGVLAGTGTLTAMTYALNGGTVINADLGVGAITANGTVALNGDTAGASLAVQTGVTTVSGDSAATAISVATGATLATAATGTFADTAAVTLTGTGTLALGQNETIGNLAGAGLVQLGSRTLTLANGAGATSAAAISGTGGVTLASGTQTLSGVSTYTGATAVSAGTLTISGASSSAGINISTGATLATGAANVLADTVVIANSGALNLGGAETIGALSGSGVVQLGTFNLTFAGDGDSTPDELTSDFSGAINGSGQITKTGTDIQVLSGASAYTGIAFVNQGVLRVTQSQALGATGANGRTEVLAGGTLQISGGITLAEVVRPTGVGAAATFTGNDSYLTSRGAISNLSGSNTLTGQIGVVGGQPDVIIAANAGTLAINGDILRFGLAAIPQLTFQAAEGATISLTGTNAVFQLSNIADLAKTGGGTLDLTTLIANQSTGNLLLRDGTVIVRTEAQLGGSNVIFGATDRGTLRIASTATQSAIAAGVGRFITGGDGTFADFRNTVFNFASGDGIFLTDADTAVRLSNLVNFTASRLVKTGAADLLIDLIDPITPLATAKVLPSLLVQQGNVFFQAADTTALTLGGLDQSGAGGNLNLGALNTTIDQAFAGTFSGGLTGTGSLTINTLTNGSLLSTGTLSGFSSVTLGGDGTGAVTLNGNSTYTGPTNVVAGGSLILGGTLASLAIDVASNAALTLTASDRLDDAATVTNAGTFALGANSDAVATFTSNGGTLTGTGTLTASTYALNNSTTINANLGTGSIEIQSGTTTLAGSSAATTVGVASGATLVTTATGSLDDTSAVTLTGTGILTLGQSETIGNLSGAGTVNLGANTLSLSNGSSATSAAVINGTGGLTLQSGTQTLSGANTYTGETNVTGGTLALTGSLVGTTINVSSGAVLTSTGGLSDATALRLSGSAAATFTGAETLASLNGAGTLAATDLTVASLNGTSTISSSGTVTASSGSFGGVLASGALVKDTGGTLTLSGTHTYTGGTTVNAGTLALTNATNTLSDSGALTVNSGATVDLGANTDTVGSFTSNAGTLAGTGTLTASTYALNNGSVVNARLGAGTGTVSGDVRLNASTGAGTFTVLNAATLRGVGTRFGGNLVVNPGGTLAPGASPGITTVAGNWTQNGTFATELGGLGGAGAINGHDQIQVGGAITLGPTSTLALQRFGAYGEPARGDSFRIIVGDIAAQRFATVTSGFTTGLVLDLADGTLYGTGLTGVGTSRRVDLTTLPGLDANTVALVGAIQADAFAADSANGVQFNSTLGASAPAGAAIRALLTSATGPGNGVNVVSPESFAAESAYAVRATRHYSETALSTAPIMQAGDFSLFAAYSSHQASTESSVNKADYDLSGYGGLVGARYTFNRVKLGAFAAFDSGNIDSSYRNADVAGTVYGLFAEAPVMDRLTVSASASTGSYESDSSRASLFAGPRARASDIDAKANGFSLGLSHELIKTKRGGFSPYIEFNYVESSSDSFIETGASDALAVQSIDYTSLQGELGARGFIQVSERFSFTGQLGVSQEFGDDETVVKGRLASGTAPIRVVSPGQGDTAVSGGVGARFDATRRVFFNAGVNASIISDAGPSTSFRIGGGMKF